MTKVILILMTVVLWSGCSDPLGVGSIFDESGWSPSTGPEGQPLELYQGKDSAGNRIDYQFYVSGADTIKLEIIMCISKMEKQAILSASKRANGMSGRYHIHSRNA